LSGLWRKYYADLLAFIKDEPGVVIRSDLISIDKTVRKEFYKKFDKVRASFLAQRISEWLDEAQFLATKYAKIEGQLTELLRLREVLMSEDLKRFLFDPTKQIVRDLFDSLFDLIQEKIEPEEFEERAEQTVNESFRNYYQMGYIKWFVLSLIKRLEPERIYEVPLPQPSSKEIIKHRQDIRQNIPFPRETKVLSFEVGRRDVLLIPDFIVRSALLEKYVAFRTDLGKAVWRATYHSEKRDWFSIEDIVKTYGTISLKPDLLLYVDENLEDVSLVADSEKICQPDLQIFFLDQLEVTEGCIMQELEEARLAHESLKPIRGTRLISKHHLPESFTKELDKNIGVIHFGFNNMKWESLLSLLQSE
jgi:hypothetical protein